MPKNSNEAQESARLVRGLDTSVSSGNVQRYFEKAQNRFRRDEKPDTVVKFAQINPLSIKFTTSVLFIV